MLTAGGERSYTTVCFALAVGEYIQSPFRAMDEFDVFMDAVNRRISMVSLFENAMLHKDVQFLFLTPQVFLILPLEVTNGAPSHIEKCSNVGDWDELASFQGACAESQNELTLQKLFFGVTFCTLGWSNIWVAQSALNEVEGFTFLRL
jgi:hypothetical protein